MSEAPNKDTTASESNPIVTPEAGRMLSVLKDSVGLLAVFVAVTYGLGYVARLSSIASFHAGQATITKESAMVAGVKLLALLLPGTLLAFNIPGYDVKWRSKWYLLPIWGVYVFTRSMLRPESTLDPFSGVTFGLMTFLLSVVPPLALRALYDMRKKAGLISNAINFSFLLFLYVNIASTYGNTALKYQGQTDGGTLGSLVSVSLKEPTASVKGFFRYEDDSWMVVTTDRQDGKGRTLRIPKSRITLVEPIAESTALTGSVWQRLMRVFVLAGKSD